MTTVLFCFGVLGASADDHDHHHGTFQVRKGTQFYTGYSRNFGEKAENFNIIELGVGRINFDGLESSGTSFYAANEFVFNSHRFSIGPKAGASFTIWMLGLGAELIYYTDFGDNALHLAPCLSFGAGMTRWNIRYHIPLYNKDYIGINQVSIGITIGLTKPK